MEGIKKDNKLINYFYMLSYQSLKCTWFSFIIFKVKPNIIKLFLLIFSSLNIFLEPNMTYMFIPLFNYLDPKIYLKLLFD